MRDKIIDDILKEAGKLNLKSVVKLKNGETGYIELSEGTFNQMNDMARIKVYFPSKNKKRGMNFDSKLFIKKFIDFEGDYEKGTAKRERNAFFKHPKFEKNFINDVLDYLGGDKKSVFDVIGYLTNYKRWRLQKIRDLEGLFESVGFEVKNNYVLPGKVKKQIGVY